MKTTFVLHGGATSKPSTQNDKFFRQFTELCVKDEVNILMCYWARQKERWEELFEKDKKAVLKNTNKKVNFTMVENPKDFYNKIDRHDVFFVTGGSLSEQIESLYPEMKEMVKKLEGKVYLGSSMGAFMVSGNYILSFAEQESGTIHQGLGLVPVNCLAHADIDKKKEIKIKMLKEKSNLPIIILDECEFVKIII